MVILRFMKDIYLRINTPQGPSSYSLKFSSRNLNSVDIDEGV